MELRRRAFVERVRELAPSSSLCVAFDTNTIGGQWGGQLRGFKAFDELCALVARVNDALRPRAAEDLAPLRLGVSALVHAEVLHDLQQHFGARFKPSRVTKELANKGLTVSDLTAHHAEELAARLAIRFPEPDAWRRHKLELAARCLGVAGRLDALGISPPAGTRCGATTDWLIGSHARAVSAVLVTEDRGAEFQDVETMVPSELVAGLEELIVSG